MACLNARRSLSTLLSRALTSSSSSSFPSRSRLTVALLNKTPIFIPDATRILTRTKTYGSGYLPFRDPSRLPAVVLYGRGDEHWLIILEFPERPKPLEEEMIDTYVKTLASVVGSEEEAKKRIYSVCTTRYTGFRALFSKDLVKKLGELPRVRWVLSDDFIYGQDRYYGGDLFVDGNVIHGPPQHGVGESADYDLWVIKFESPRNIDFYVKFLACLVGSEEEAKRRIYADGGRLTRYTGFCAVMSEEMAYELEGFPLVKRVDRVSEAENDAYLETKELLSWEFLDAGPTFKEFLDVGPTFQKLLLREERRLLRLLDLVMHQILNDIYTRKMDETETEG
ncbi:hypothetical protein E1A91_D13G250700v1 [Gossypium mustelinum]|uniref:MORF/ORRM1/DAG-like MORF domain-containing protein n=1 Tax=Gossypium mustelinum TaxID=34275 RepID=A0A5D2S5N0_GOSMU|nr:hypothetical protein E1A91_D13G250700v1 [Gossypium mustelinum]